MAQNFRRYTANNVGTAPSTLVTADTYDAIVGISLENVHTSAINVDCYFNDGTNDIYLVKDAPIPVGGALQILDGGAKVVLDGTTSDALKVVSDTASSLDAWVSAVDAIST